MLNITTFLDANACRLDKTVFYCPERDEATFGAVDMLAERFNNCLFEAAGAFNVNASKASDYAAEGKNNVDYIIVMVSEENLPTLIPDNA